MKKILLLTINLLCFGKILAAVGENFVYEYGGNRITYTILSETDRTCKTKNGNYNFPGNPDVSCDLIIPEKALNSSTGIEYKVTEIGEYSFNNCEEIKGSLTLPKNLTSIGERAFYGCTGFTGSLILPENLTTIEANAFYGCTGFTGSLILPENLTTIEANAFSGCRGFTGELILPDNLTTIGQGAFEYCSGFTGSLNLPDNLTTIGQWAFGNCRGFTGSLILPENLTTIGAGTFSGCTGFTGELILPENLMTIGPNAFDGCTGFTGDLRLPENLTTIKSSAFYGCTGFTGKLILPDNLTTIEREVFYGCTGFTGDLILPANLTTIENSVFYKCSGFTGELRLPKNLTTIGRYAFDLCTGFTGELVLPASLTTIETAAFYGCSGFSKVMSYAIEPPVCGSLTVFENILYTTVPLIVPEESLQKYSEAYVWKEFKTINKLAPRLESISITSESMEGRAGKHGLKQTEELYFTATLSPEDADFEKVVWSAVPDVVEFVYDETDGTEVTAKVKGDAPVGDVTITATADGTEVKAAYEVSVSELLPGDANDSGAVNVADVAIVIGEILKRERNLNLCFVNADVVADKMLDVADQAAVQNISLGREPFASGQSRVAASRRDALTGNTATNGNNVYELNLSLENADGYIILQADIELPSGFDFTGIKRGAQSSRHQLDYNMIEENVIRVILYSELNESFASNSGNLFTVEGNAGADCGEIVISNIIVADTYGGRHEIGYKDGKNEAGLDRITEEEGTRELYNLQGVKITNTGNLLPGVYIINGKKAILK